MTLRLREVVLDLDDDEALLAGRVERELGLPAGGARDLRVQRRGIDARKKPHIRRVYTVDFEVVDEEAVLGRHGANPRLARVSAEDPLPWVGQEAGLLGAPQAARRPLEATSLGRPHRALVVGMGPAGLFAALGLARSGAAVTLVERGRPVEERARDVARFWEGAGLDPESNMQFGEGGAGAFSDGKLTTRIHHRGVQQVLRTLVACGAPEKILTDAKPHLGTDQLRGVLRGMRGALSALGVELRFSTRLTGLLTQGASQEAIRAAGAGEAIRAAGAGEAIRAAGAGEAIRAAGIGASIRAAVLDDREEVSCDSLVLAPGHSARDTYAMLAERGVALEPKAFALGLRIEHPAALIHRIQYGRGPHPSLPAPEYAVAWTDRQTGRAVYSFCMCPGGQVVIAASEPGGVVVNGMSDSARDGERSNAALVVTVREEDFGAPDPLAGVRLQRCYEEAAFRAGGGDYRAPAANVLSFLGRGHGPVEASCRPGVREANLDEVLPGFVAEELRRALPHFDRKLRGFVTREAVLLGVESRTSAPLRILRAEDGQSVSHPGLYPAGEGAGYAGGIVSSAVDGLRAAQCIASRQGLAQDRSPNDCGSGFWG